MQKQKGSLVSAEAKSNCMQNINTLLSKKVEQDMQFDTALAVQWERMREAVMCEDITACYETLREIVAFYKTNRIKRNVKK